MKRFWKDWFMDPEFAAAGPMCFGRHRDWGRGGPFGGGFGDWGGREERTRRGDIKFLLLELLAEQPRHGYDLIKELEARRSGFSRPSPGSVYPTLQLLEDGGFLTSAQVDGKRVYTITESGRELLASRGAPKAEQPFGDFQPFADLKDTAMELGGAVMQAARSGKVERVTKVREILERAKREIYSLLSEEG